MHYPIVLLDADDTLFDFVKAERMALKKSMEEVGLPYTEELAGRYRVLNQTLWEMLERGEITKPRLQTLRFEQLFGEMGASADPEDFHRRYLDHLGEGSYLLPGAEEVCRALRRDRRLFLVTNGTASAQRRRFGASPLTPYFEGVFISELIGAPKPSVAFFEAVFREIPGFSRERTVIVGDSLTSDIQGGKNAGIATCWVNTKGKTAPPGCRPDLEVRSLQDLPEVI